MGIKRNALKRAAMQNGNTPIHASPDAGPSTTGLHPTPVLRNLRQKKLLENRLAGLFREDAEPVGNLLHQVL